MDAFQVHKINKDKIFNFIMSLRDSDSSFVLQKKFNQSTLMSSAFSLLTLELIGCIESLNSQAYVNPFLQNQDKASGLIIDPKLIFEKSSLEDPEKNYIHYQTTAFSLSAIDALGYTPKYSLAFLDYFRDKKNINKYFENIDWSNPWHESNKIMFLLQFFSYELIRLKDESARKYIDQILDLLDKYQDSNTGLWGTQYGASSFSAMAAGYHFLMFYQHFNREIRFKQLVVESVCDLQMKDGLFHPFGGGGACEDMDAIDVLVKSMSENESKPLRCLERSHFALTNNFNSDGGFCWAKRPTFPLFFGLGYLNPLANLFSYDMCKWVIKNNILGSFIPFLREKSTYSYSNWNQMKYDIGLSDSWSTWFRLLSLATIEDKIPSLKQHNIDFKFRSLPSIGCI